MRYDRTESPFSLTPWVRGLLIANAVVYLLRLTVFTGPWFVQTFGFSPLQAGQHWWSFVTYMFVHDGFFHLAFNMLLLFFFGRAVEERMGGTPFALYYLVCGLGGAVFSYVIPLVTPMGYVVGASAAVYGVLLAFAMHWPNAPIYIFPLPMPVKAKWLVMALVGLDLAASALQWRDGIAHFAHLGGFLFGLIYLKSEAAVVRRARAAVHHRPPQLVAHRVPVRSAREAGESGREASSAGASSPQEDVNRLLDKISSSGLDSLTPEERRLLDEASRQLRQH